MGRFLRLYLNSWWMPTVVSFATFLLLGLFGTFATPFVLSNRGSTLAGFVFLAMIPLGFLWPLSIIAILIIGFYHWFWGDDTVGTRNIWLGIASIVAAVLFSWLGLAVT